MKTRLLLLRYTCLCSVKTTCFPPYFGIFILRYPLPPSKRDRVRRLSGIGKSNKFINFQNEAQKQFFKDNVIVWTDTRLVQTDRSEYT